VARALPPIRAAEDGSYVVDLGPNERELLRAVAEQLKELLLETDGPVLRRLFPPPYGDDTERNEGYAALARPELIDHRTAALDVLIASAGATTLDEDEIGAWMRSINDVRLVLGTVLEIDDDEADIVVDESNVATFQAYELLGFLLEAIVTARSQRL
jgi:hypothetical protein